LVVASLLAKTPRSRDRAAAPLAYLVLPITRSRRLAGRAGEALLKRCHQTLVLEGVTKVHIAEFTFQFDYSGDSRLLNFQ